MPGPINFPKLSIADSIHNRILNIQDEIDEALFIQESFDATSHLPGQMGGVGDRARHIYWQQALADEYGPGVARTLGLLHEATGLVKGSISDGPVDTLKETWNDILTNETALTTADGAPDIETIQHMVEGLETDEEGNAVAATPMNIYKAQN